VEREPRILREFLSNVSLKDWCDERDIYFLSGNDTEDIINRISGIQIKYNLLPFSLVEHTPSVRAFPEFYTGIKNRLTAVNRVNFGAKFRYPKFKSRQLGILILHSKYYLLGEILNSLNKMGHRTKVIMVQSGREGEGSQEVIENIIAEIVSFKPDFILTINHLGFDREGILTQFFTDIELPYASWYVDSPLFILEEFKKQISPYLSVFVWDNDYIQDLKALGFENVYFLPLATDPDIFKKVQIDKNPLRHLMCDVGFVGNSGQNIITECLEKIKGDENVKKLLDRIARQFFDSKERYLQNVDFDLNAEECRLYEWLMKHFRDVFAPAVTWRATQIYRLRCVKKLMPFSPHIHGDTGWLNCLNGQAVLRSELNYYDELPFFYNACKINFNTTSLQMKQGINQRVFDVPACGAFLLTDYRAQIEDMFRIGEEVICYSHPDEITDLISFYLRHTSQRMKVVTSAYERVLKEHTYVFRAKKLIDKMKRHYG
jgi:spore maturation protein CgeB